MWQIYDELIDCLPHDLVVEDCLTGLTWTLVRSLGMGVAMTPTYDHQETVTGAGTISGMPVRTLAQRIKSWNNLDAALGLAAINSVINAPATVERNFAPAQLHPDGNVFETMHEELRGRKVALIGHFRGLEPLSEICELTILERTPCPGDLPDPACEYVLASQDTIFITATTLINKTLPRLLQLSRHACVILTGPSAPLAPLFFNHGVSYLAGQVVRNPDAVSRQIREGGRHDFGNGETQMLTLSARDLKASGSAQT